MPDPKFPAAIPPVGTAKRGMEGYFSYLLRQASTMVRSEMDRRLSGFGLTFPQYTSLVMINAYPGLSNADLARITLLTPQTVNAVVQTLERSGFIERTAHPSHRKILCLTITARGTARLTEARATTREIETILKGELDADEALLVRQWLTRVAVKLSSSEATDS